MSAISWSAIDRRAPPIGTHEIERAIERDELFVLYRPQARLVGTGTSPRLTALLRWQHPRWGALSPEAFMPRASRAGLATTLTEWLLSAALRQTRTWRRAGDDVDISIDLWPADIHRYLAGTLAAALEFSGAAPAAITCEIPERALADDPARAANVTAELSWLGVRVSLDGFGGSAPSLARLRALHLNELKLAPELIADLETSADRAAVAVTAVACAQAFGVEVVACGVRSADELAAVRALGCDAAEGPAVSGPLDAPSALTWLHARPHDG
jgi:EAL domain-containing protein (putative c-di-GMP-specific phosphodiesterase class I)